MVPHAGVRETDLWTLVPVVRFRPVARSYADP